MFFFILNVYVCLVLNVFVLLRSLHTGWSFVLRSVRVYLKVHIYIL